MATPLPPEQWTRLRVLPASRDPADEAQQQRLRQHHRQQWEQAAAVAPQVRALKEKLEAEWLPQMQRDVDEARAQAQAAKDRLSLRIVAEQGYQVLEASGEPGRSAVFISAEDQANDTDLVVANARLKALIEGHRRLREQLDAANQHLNLVDHQAPSPEG